jgi:2-dehydropantoate 2-reductase
MVRYAILGTGAVGGLYGGRLAHAAHEVHFLARGDADVLKREGLHIQTPTGSFHLPHPHIHQSVEGFPPCDVVVVAWKSTANDQLPALLPKLLAAGGMVLVLQNGLDMESDAAAIVGPSRVLGGCCFLCCNRVAPGKIKHLDFGRIVAAAYANPGQTPTTAQRDRLAAVVDDFRGAGIDIQTHDDIRFVRWRKLMWNIPFNGLSVVINAATDKLMAHLPARQLAEALSEEVRQAAAACGTTIPADTVQRIMDDTDRMVPYESSMRLDWLAQRPMEVDAIFGRAVRAAHAAGFAAPRITMLYQQLQYLASTPQAAHTAGGTHSAAVDPTREGYRAPARA